MDFSFATLAAGLVFGTIGVWMIKQGKSQGKISAILIGLALIIFPYFISQVLLVWTIGIVLILVSRKI